MDPNDRRNKRWRPVTARRRSATACPKTAPDAGRPGWRVGRGREPAVLSPTWREQLQIAVQSLHRPAPADIAIIAVVHTVVDSVEADRAVELGCLLAAEYRLQADWVLVGSRLTIRFSRRSARAE